MAKLGCRSLLPPYTVTAHHHAWHRPESGPLQIYNSRHIMQHKELWRRNASGLGLNPRTQPLTTIGTFRRRDRGMGPPLGLLLPSKREDHGNRYRMTCAPVSVATVSMRPAAAVVSEFTIESADTALCGLH
ncbi:hypothetical protein NQZ68_030682 [Dissostichus eleginoides]|nr:hypothetical protein NQZ68_030682 [Dissostichus eleginoides]